MECASTLVCSLTCIQQSTRAHNHTLKWSGTLPWEKLTLLTRHRWEIDLKEETICEYICVNVRQNINEKDTFFQVCERVEQLQNSWTEDIQPLTTQKGGMVHLVFSNDDQQRCLATPFNAIKNHPEMLWTKDRQKGKDAHEEDWRCLEKNWKHTDWLEISSGARQQRKPSGLHLEFKSAIKFYYFATRGICIKSCSMMEYIMQRWLMARKLMMN